MTKAKQGATLQATGTKPVRAKKIGRPSSITETVQLELCARLSGGESLNKICRDPKMPSRSSVMRALHGKAAEFSSFRAHYQRARESLLDVYADQIIDIADDGTTDYIIKTGRNGHEYEAVDQDHIQRSRLRVEARKWILSKLRPEQYGDKIIAEGTSTLIVKHDITSLSEREKMRRFALFMVEDHRQPVIEGQIVAGTKSLEPAEDRQAVGPTEDDNAPA